MNSKSFVVTGLAFGDEGKGSYTDFLVHENNIKILARYAGGNQSNRTVTLDNGQKINFNQLSSGMIHEDAETYITENVLINLDDLIREVNDLSRLTGEESKMILRRIHINKNCIVVTPYHKLINHLSEIIAGSKRRGSVGLGVSEARYLNDNYGICIRFGDLLYNKNKTLSYKQIYDFALKLFGDVSHKILNRLPANVSELVRKEASELLNEKTLRLVERRETNIALALSQTIYENDYDILCCHDNVLFEGSLGFLLDKEYGLAPNTSLCDTTNGYPRKIIDKNDDVTYYGIIKAYYQRHGRGVFPTESGFLNKSFTDLNAKEGYWNGKVRFGWFDLILFDYSCRCSKVDEILMSSLDMMSCLKEIKICDSYYYNGVIDDEFKETFEYEMIGDVVYITSIKKVNSSRVTYYLKNSKPHYIIFKGWNVNIKDAQSFNDLPQKCIDYIRTIEALSGKTISYVSVGPTHVSKIKVPKLNE